MGKALVIVESPAKAKTINKYLGNKYIVKSSIGHIRDLPINGVANKKSRNVSIDQVNKKVKQDKKIALVNRMGVDPYHGWRAHYEILPGKEQVALELKLLAEKAEHIYLATDLDREGEAIAWHLREVIGGDNRRFSRVVFNEITKNAINQAFKQPVNLDINRVNAQQARRFMDRIVGYMVSPLLWKKIARGLSAGRVQSVAVRLVVEREREIKAFVPAEYWELYADLLTNDNITLRMKVMHMNDKPFKPVTYQKIHATTKLLKKSSYIVCDRKNKKISSKPWAPFITSTLQQVASTRLGFGVKKTMMIAQKLYESGYITYMRTDSTNISQNALTIARHYIGNNFGIQYLPNVSNQYSNKENSQEAHEAIRPSDIYILAAQLEDMTTDTKKLYELIWRQFIACQMTPAEYDSTTLSVNAGNYQLRATGRMLRFDGWTKIIPSARKGDEDYVLPFIEINSSLELQQLILNQHFTKPPVRYTEASLVKELEKRGIGRPSTYASIISTIQDRGYVRVNSHRFYAEKMGEIVTDRLAENFYGLMNYDFTACMEDQLDQIANNHTEWKVVLDEFFADFSQQLKIAEKVPEEGGMRPNQMVRININCPTCGHKMGIKTASTGVFLGCSRYALPSKERCKTTINLVPTVEALNILEGDAAETNALRARSRCQKCGTAMDEYLMDNQRKLIICGNNPICDGYEIEEGEFCVKGCDGRIVQCNKCRSTMHLKIGRFGKYIACTNEHCKNTRKVLRSGDIAPEKEDPISFPELPCKTSNAYFILREGKSGVFFAANTFPKSRETRAPLVEELAQFKERLYGRLRYLADAPVIDNVGNKTLVRFSRKTKQQYITSEKDGKTTGWFAFYVDGKWVVQNK
ncbi:type I DNA topoisomerase [Candidatus Gillettellia adelgis]